MGNRVAAGSIQEWPFLGMANFKANPIPNSSLVCFYIGPPVVILGIQPAIPLSAVVCRGGWYNSTN
jgi:hypothetical protein